MILTTMEGVPEKRITQVLGVVTSSGTAWVSVQRLYRKLFEDLKREAEALGADAIVDIKIADSVFSASVIGTAVKLEHSTSREELV